jgi:DNA-binding response OmpR family regulator
LIEGSGPRTHPGYNAPMRALVVSDRESNRRWIRSALGPDWEVLEAATGLEARDACEQLRVDLVVTDQTAQPYGAFGLTRDVKMLPNPPAVIILLERAQDVWLSKWAGADRWFVRPVHPFELARAATELAGERAVATPAPS